jgi:imidazolonepropionase-like amidohydrolase
MTENSSRPIAFVGATLIDGNGGVPLANSAVVVKGGRIVAVGTRDSVTIPSDSTQFDVSGKYLLPGFIDTNVHIAPIFNPEELARSFDRASDIAIETAQVMLTYGVTTMRDSYGMLTPLLKARDAMASGDAIGPRVLVAGNIVGWGGPGSFTFGSPGTFTFDTGSGMFESRPSYFLEKMQDEFTHGTGEELLAMEPDELREAMQAYLSKGVDFIKYGGTSHGFWPSAILFSPRAQEVIVEETHRCGKVVDTHSTSPEGVRISLLAGVDLVQHPEFLDVPMSDEIVALHVEKDVVCSMNVNYWSGRRWDEYQERMEKERAQRAEMPQRRQTAFERIRERHSHWVEWGRANAKKLIAAGCRVSTASDSLTLQPPDFTRGDEEYHSIWHPGDATLISIEGLVDVGLTPLEALTCATKHGAEASRALDDYGTVEAGKSADLLVLDADPVENIRNIRTLSTVLARGTIVGTDRLPMNPVYYRVAAPAQ